MQISRARNFCEAKAGVKTNSTMYIFETVDMLDILYRGDQNHAKHYGTSFSALHKCSFSHLYYSLKGHQSVYLLSLTKFYIFLQ